MNSAADLPKIPFPDADRIRADLLDWYDQGHRTIPWRMENGTVADPYQVWLSEIMCQQTTVGTAIPYFENFIRRWPTIGDLATAGLDDVLHAWQGLGYYARARNLHACARKIADELNGRFPDTEEELRALPGIGTYTAAAISAMAFGRCTLPVDGNILRVLTRLYAIANPLPQARILAEQKAATLASPLRPGDLAQSMMDLGALVCIPRNPRCEACPITDSCAGHAAGIATNIPVKPAKPTKPTRTGIAFWMVRDDGAVLLRRRPESGLLGGLMAVPMTTWRETPWSRSEIEDQAPASGPWQPLPGQVVHVFTHFRLETGVWIGRTPLGANLDGVWVSEEHMGDHALPTLMRKVARHVRAHTDR